MEALGTELKERVAMLAKKEASQNFKGSAAKAGPEIEKFLSPFRKYLQ